MAAWRVNGVLLPGGDPIDGAVNARGRWTSTPPAGVEELPGRFFLPGLADAHCHLSIGQDANGDPTALTIDETRANLTTALAAGITVARDVGSPGSITLRLPARGDGTRLLASGRFLAPEGRYFPALHVPVPAEALAEAALAEIAAGARWVKLVGDFPVLGQTDRSPLVSVPTYAIADVRGLVEAVHGAGARVAVHTNTSFVKELIAVGVDSVEHGDGLDEEDLKALAARGGAWTPTLCAGIEPHAGDDPERRRRRARRRERLGYLLPVAAGLGVTIMAGTDLVGSIAREVALMTELGLTPEAALAAASTAAHDFLGLGGLQAGELVDLVGYHGDPREDPGVLAEPVAVVVQGVRVH